MSVFSDATFVDRHMRLAYGVLRDRRRQYIQEVHKVPLFARLYEVGLLYSDAAGWLLISFRLSFRLRRRLRMPCRTSKS